MATKSTHSPKINHRIKRIETDLTHYRNSLLRLNKHIASQQQMKRAPHAPRIIKYTCIPRSEKRFQWTIAHITSQVALLEKERETLIQYGK